MIRFPALKLPTAILLAFGLMAFFNVGAKAASEINSSFLGNVAVEGIDPVAYFTEKKAVKGASGFTHSWKGAAWRFKNKANLDAFAANPEKYAPQFGGYCAWGVSQGYAVKIDPEAWTIHKGKLYLNYSKGVRSDWLQDIPGNISKAEKNWPKVLEN